jgi:cobalt-precorrin 5A hydrolase/precorrin-3B C17-methyltransferase
LATKHDEPPVVAVAEDGSAVVPLLGGHHGGNDLARDEIASVVDGFAAITTAGDLKFGIALDAPPEGWMLANPAAKQVMADLVAGKSARLEGEARHG